MAQPRGERSQPGGPGGARRPRGSGVVYAALLAAALFELLAATPAAAVLPGAGPSTVPHRLVIGVPTFASEAELDPGVEPWATLDRLSRLSEAPPFERPLEIEVALGNPYQVLAWLEGGEIDGAVVSALGVQLLAQQQGSSGSRFVKVALPGDPLSAVREVMPRARVRRCPSDGAATTGNQGAGAGDDPASVLEALFDEALAGSLEEPEAIPYRLVLPSHLSAAALGAVLGRAEPWLATELAGLPLADRRRLAAGFWRQLLATTSYSLGRPLACAGTPEGGGWTEIELTGDDDPGDGAGGWVELPALLFSRPVAVAEFLLVKESVATTVLPPAFVADTSTTASEALFRRLLLDRELRGELERRLGRTPGRRSRAYPFTVGEALELIRLAQRNEPERGLAVVLPGGGVKAAYQSVLIDHLYGNGRTAAGAERRALLVNRPAAGDGDPQPVNGALPVRYVVGNSGGALLGYFVARLGEGDPRRLARLLWEVDGRALDSTRIFGAMDLMRWATVVAVLWTFAAFLFLAGLLSWASPFRRQQVQRDEGRRWFRSLGLVALLAATPLVLKYVKGEAGIEHVPALEGLLYFGCLFLAVLADDSMLRTGTPSPTSVLACRGPLALLAAGSATVIATLIARASGADAAAWLESEIRFAGPRWVGIQVIFWAVVAAAVFAVWQAVSEARTAARDGIHGDGSARRRAGWWLGAVLVLGAVVAAAAADLHVSRGALAVSIGVLAMIAGLVSLFHRRPHRYSFAPARRFTRAIAIPLLVILLSHLALTAAVAAGALSWLEMTLAPWKLALAAGLAASAALFVAGRVGVGRKSGPLRWLASAFSHLYALHPASRVGMARYQRMVLYGTLGFAWWNLIQAPALYGNDHARRYLAEVVERFEQAGATPEAGPGALVEAGALAGDADVAAGAEVRFNALFAVPANTLEKGEERYFLFTPEPCAPLPPAVERDRGRWRVFRGPTAPEVAERIVFASGSPFPIFPPHLVEYPRGGGDPCNGNGPAASAADGAGAVEEPELVRERLVDGGYAHNIPVEAVERLGARQVLIVHSSPIAGPAAFAELPEGLEDRRPEAAARRPCGTLVRGQLVCNAPRLIPFLFERAQQADRLRQEGLMVVSLAPDPDDSWPPLFDFRRVTVERMREAARRDLSRRIARVENWGAPTRYTVVRGGEWMGGAPSPGG